MYSYVSNVNHLAEGIKNQKNDTTRKYSDKGVSIKILLLRCSDFFLYLFFYFIFP